MPTSSLTLAEVLQILNAPLEELTAWALLHNAAGSIQDAHEALQRSLDSSLSGVGPHLIIHHETLFLHRRGRLQFSSGIQTSVDARFSAPELQQKEINGGKDLAQAQVFSLSMVVSTALDYEEKREVSAPLNSLLTQMESKDASKRPTLATIIKLSAEHMETLSANSSADDELDKLFSMVYGDQDQLETSFADSDSVADDLTLAAELAAVEQRRRNSIGSTDLHSSVNESHSEDCMSLTSKGSVGVHGSMDSLHRQGSTRSTSSTAGGLNPSTLRGGDNGRKMQKMAPNARWSSYERLRLQQKESDSLQANKNSTDSLFYTPVRHRRAGTPPGAGLPPRPPSIKVDDHSSNMDPRIEASSPSTETQKLDQLLVEIDNSPLHSESAPDLIAAGVEPFLPPASSTPNIIDYSDRKQPSKPLLVNVHPEVDSTATTGWQQEKVDETDSPPPSPPPSLPPQLPSQENNSTFEYSSMPVPEASTAMTLSGEFLFNDPTQDQDDSNSLPPSPPPPLPSSQLPSVNDQETAEGDVITTSMALNEALEVLDNDSNLNETSKDSPYEALSWEKSPEQASSKNNEEVDGYSVPRLLTSEITKASSSPLSSHKRGPEKPKPLTDNLPEEDKTDIPEEDKVYAVVNKPKKKKKEVTPSDIVLRHMQPPSLRSSSVEDVSRDTAVVTEPYRASMPPDLLLEHSPSLQTDPPQSPISLTPEHVPPQSPMSLSPEHGESLILPSSDYSINKLQTVFGDEFMQLSGGPRKNNSEVQLSLDTPKKKRVVHVHLLNDTVLTLYVNPTCMCRDFFHHVACLLDVQEWISFGLSVFQDDGKPHLKALSPSSSEEIFLEPDRQIYKYAPAQWMKMPPPEPGDRNPRHQSPPFTVHFRVMFYIRRLSQLGNQQTRHLYYLQLRQDLRRGRLECSWNEQLKLTALALQCEYGDFSNIATPQQYFKARHYLPQMVVREKSEQTVTEQLTELHAGHIGMTSEQAEERFLQEAMSLKNYGKIVYNVTRQETKTPAQMTFTVNGISVYDVQNNRKRCVVECIWRSINNIAFDHRKITLMVEGRDPVVILASSFKRAAYLLRFVKLCHKFQIYTRTHAQQPPQPLPSLTNQVESSSVKPVPAAEDKLCPEYEGELMTVKMLKREGQGVGLRISNHIAPTGVTYAEVETLVEGGVAARYLKTGDLLLKLNDKALHGLNHHEVGEMFRTSPPLLKVVVLRRTSKDAAPNAMIQSEDKLDQENVDNEVKASTQRSKVPPAPPVRHLDLNSTKNDSPEAEQQSRVDSSETRNDSGKESSFDDTVEENTVAEASIEPILADKTNEFTSLESEATDGAATAESSRQDLSHFISTTTLESHSLDETDVPPVPISIGDTKTLRIRRKDGSFGFAIKGSTKNRYRPVRVSTITEGGAAEETGLCIGDRIISVNGQAIEGRGYKEAFHLLQTSGEVVTILIAKGQPGTDKLSVTLNKNDGALGFRYAQEKEYTTVTSVTRNSQAAKAGLKEGDLILEINGQSLMGVSQREVYALMAGEQSTINLLVEKNSKPLESIPEQLDIRPEEYRSGTLVTITLRKENRQLGFKIKKNPVTIREHCGLFVTSIEKDPALSDGRILVNDELVKVNGKSLIGLSHENALQLLKGEPDECMFVIRRQTAHPQVLLNDDDDPPPSLPQTAPPDTTFITTPVAS